MHSALNTCVNSGDIFLGNGTAHNLVDKLVALTAFIGFDTKLNMAVLTLTTRLTGVLGVDFGIRSDCFLIGNLRSAYVGFNLKFTKKSVHNDFKVKLTHTRDDCLTGFLVRPCSEGGVFLGEFCQSKRHLFLTRFGLRFDSQIDNGIGEFHGFENYGIGVVTKSIACGGVLKTYRRRNIAAIANLKILPVVGVHLENTSHTLFFALGSVENGGTRLYHTGVNSKEAKLTYEGVGSDFERQSGKRLVVSRFSVCFLAGVGIGSLYGGDIKGRRHVVNYCVEQLLNTLVLIGSTADYGYYLIVYCADAKTSFNFLNGDFLTFEVLVHDLFILLGNCLQKLISVLGSQILHVVGNLFDSHILAQIIVIDVGLHFNEVDYSSECVFRTDRELNRNRIGFKAIFHHLHYVEEVGAHNVHFVYISHSGNLILVRLTPYRFRLGLNAAFSAEYGNRAVKHSQ